MVKVALQCELENSNTNKAQHSRNQNTKTTQSQMHKNTNAYKTRIIRKSTQIFPKTTATNTK